MRQFAVTLLAALLAAGSVKAADRPGAPADDTDALSIADKAEEVKPSSRAWRVFGEGALSRTWMRGDTSAVDGARASFDLRYDGTIAPDLRAVLSNRLDLRDSNTEPRERSRNTLREAYLSWHAAPDAIVDIGRVNLRYGAAFGYNPTDFFKAGALRSIVSPDPASLRENRQGTVVVQGQKLWGGSSLSAAFSPRLGSTPSNSTFALDAAATNPSDRWLLAGSHAFGPAFNPQVLLFGGGGTALQTGLNLSGLLNSATVAYFEATAGKGRSLTAQALGEPESERTQHRAALGLTYTTAFNLSLTAEFEHNSAAPNRREWHAFRNSAPANALRLLGAAQDGQDLPVRRALFAYVSWRDMFKKNLDLSAYVRHDTVTRSRDQWIELRHRWESAEVAVQWQLYSGDRTSLYGSVPRSRQAEVLIRLYL